ncbi:MAG: CRISPR-associated endoribonuclease Cas6 [Bacteroidia bacterium]|nr:CRISPR-associated endoribonuclease Cas6 [Bacteroidia bacterium]
MRLQIGFSAKHPLFLPWRYPELLMGLFYRWLNQANLALGMQLHARGWVAEGHRYKLYTFSWLQAKALQAETAGLRLTPPLYWQVSSPVSALIEAFTQGIWRDPKVTLGRMPLQVETVEVLPEPLPDRSPVRVRTLSPITISTVEMQESWSKGRKVFLTPQDSAFSRILGENLRRKAQVLGLSISVSDEVVFLPLRVRSRLVHVHGTQVRAYEGLFLYEGPLSLFRVGYQAGFGERSGQGFGMIEIVDR